MKKQIIVRALLVTIATLVAVACSSNDKNGTGTPQLVAQVYVGNDLANGLADRNAGNFSNEYCLQRVRFMNGSTVVQERLLVSAKICNGLISSGDAVISKKIVQASPSIFTVVEDKSASVLMGEIDVDATDGRLYLNQLCDQPSANPKYAHCTISLDSDGHFAGVTEQ
jgi:hypothetical protein